jgi:aspartate ammonia-lyase
VDNIRVEHDPLGAVSVLADRLYGAQTARALANFPLSGRTIAEMPALLVSLAQVKKAAVLANSGAGELPAEIADAISLACDEIIGGSLCNEFVVDVFQGGAGTSTNMNMNEVLANRALQHLGLELGRYDVIHPNDHVNRSQSTNDAYSTAVRLAVYALNTRLIEALRRLQEALCRKEAAFDGIPKLGRTQLQDAVPMTLGQEFGAFATTVGEDAARAREIGEFFLEINLGGTAIGTGIGASPAYAGSIIAELRKVTGQDVKRAANLIEATWDMGAFVLYSGMLKRVASKLSKIANDLRLLASGPRGGFGEIQLPERQPGSSIMPGKVNPVILEALNQVAFRVFGTDVTVTFAAEGGQLQLNAFEPVILLSIYEAVDLLISGIDMLIMNCIEDLSANEAGCAANLARSTALSTALVPHLGYARCAALAKAAIAEGVDLRTAIARLDPAVLPLFDAMSGRETV